MAELQKAEQKDILLALGRGYNGFYCPESRFHLIGVVKPQAYWPKGLPLSEDAKRAIAGGTIVDVNNALSTEDVKFQIHGATPMSSNDRKKAQQVEMEEQGVDVGTEEYVADKAIMSEPDIDSATKKELDAFIKKNAIVLDGVNSRTNLDDLKDALKVHFGYKEVAEAK